MNWGDKPIEIVCLKWERPPRCGLPAVCNYGSKHVNIMYRSLLRKMSKPFRFTCISDDFDGLDTGIRRLPIWDRALALGRCYNRMYCFTQECADYMRVERFVSIDLDCVIVGDPVPLFERTEPFVMNSYNGLNPDRDPDQFYNGSMFMMEAGCREQVWASFDKDYSPKIIERKPKLCIGSDQAWIRLVLGKNEARWSNYDGVYEYRQVRDGLPPNAKIIFFSGKRDPSILQHTHQCIRENWQ